MKPRMGWVSPGTRWMKGMSASLQPSWTLHTARNQRVFAQCVIVCDKPVWVTVGEHLSFDWSAGLPRARLAARLEDESGTAAVTSAEVSLRWIGFVPDEAGNMVADPILTKDSLELIAGEGQPLWVEIRIPKDAAPGEYTLKVTAYLHEGWNAETAVASCELRIVVHRVVLPDPAGYAFHLDFWQHPTRWAAYYNVPRWSKQHWRIIESMALELASCGQKAITVIASDAPWGGQSCRLVESDPLALYEFNMIQVIRDADGNLRCDFTVLDKYVETFHRAGVRGEIEVYGLLGVWQNEFGQPIHDYPDPVRVRYYDVRRGVYDFLGTKEDLRTYIRLLVDHFRARGWFESVRIASDEPANVEQFTECLDFLSSIDHELRFKIACNHVSFMDRFKDRVLDWAPNIRTLVKDAEVTRRLIREVRQRNGRMTWYLSMIPEYPNSFLNSPLHETRLIGWLTDWFGVDGFLRWAVAAWPPQPWDRPKWRFPAGDLFFLYPGHDGTPVTSLRWEMLRQGIQEYELLQMARRAIEADAGKAGLRQRLRAAQRRTFRVQDLDEFNLMEKSREELYADNYEDFDEALRVVLELLDELLVEAAGK